MGSPIRILAMAGSARRESFNRRFLAVAVEEARSAGCEVAVADLGELALPLYNGDLEESGGMPPGALRLAGLVASHQALLVASPEYNSMPSPLLKNALDWCSRAEPNPFEGRVAAVMSASPGPFGGIGSLRLAQQLLLKLGCHVVPGQCVLPHADKAFDPEGRLANPRTRESVRTLVADLARIAARMAS